MPNNQNTKKKQTKSVTKSVTKSYKPSTEEQRRKWREAKKKQKANKLNKQKHIDFDDFELFDINDDSIMDSPGLPSSIKYTSPPEIINNNPFRNEIIRYNNESEENLIRPFKDEPLSLQNTPTKPKKGGKTRKNKKR